jgi:4-hydroxy-3-methylbut-2-enyl diphosphate reductase
MRVIRAEFMGLCFGVRDALAIARETKDPSAVTIYGELVHNPTIQEELSSRGFRVVGEMDRETVELTDRVMVTAHGISQRRMDLLKAQSTEIIDTTCPLVRRVHEATQTLQSENRLVILIGRRKHVEVQGIVEDLRQCIVVEDLDQIIDWKAPLLGVVSQSTTTPELAQRCLSRILELNTHADVRYVDTICRPTRQRQQALEALCQSVSLVIVVGGKHSNNTRQLAQRCLELGCKAIQVESAVELQPEWFADVSVVGLTAGTSTPDGTIEEVAKKLARISATLPTTP